MIPIAYSMVVSVIIFTLGVVGIMCNRNHVILALISIELMLLGANINFLAFSQYFHDIAGQIFVFFILTVAAAEAAIGLAIVLIFYRNRGSIEVDTMDRLKG
jgi:NADH-quinone oxidoreductase subunit K